MRFSISAINSHFKQKISTEDMCLKLMQLGFEVEDVIDSSKQIEGIIVGKVIDCSKHPSADRLSLCKVNIGEGKIRSVVCGASNVRQGLLVAFADIGTLIPSTNFVLKPAVIRGVASEGMLCSAKELCLKDDGLDGIMELNNCIPGEKLKDVLGINEVYLDLSITPNRKDCFDEKGLARDLACSKIAELKEEFLNKSHHNFQITLRDEVNCLGGISIPIEECEEILKNLNCLVERDKDVLLVTPPLYRNDLKITADIVEEILRIKGYDAIPTKSLEVKKISDEKNDLFLQRLLTFRGFLETYSFSLVNENEAKLFSDDYLKVVETKTLDMHVLRPSLYINLLKSCSYNQRRFHKNLAFFEIGKEYKQSEVGVLSGILTEELLEQNWAYKTDKVTIFHAKDILREMFEVLDIKYQVKASNYDWYHPFKQGIFCQGQKILAHFGEIHPRIQKFFELKGPVVGFTYYTQDNKHKKAFKAWNKNLYPPVSKDFCFVVDNDLMSIDLVNAIKKKVKPKDIKIFDVFNDENRSLTIQVTFQDEFKTLSEEEINAKYNEVVDVAKKEFNAYIKGM